MSYTVQSYTLQQYCDVHVSTSPSATPIDIMCSTQTLKFKLANFHLFKHIGNVKYNIHKILSTKYEIADIRHFEYADLISLFAILIDIMCQNQNVFHCKVCILKYYLYDPRIQQILDTNSKCLVTF